MKNTTQTPTSIESRITEVTVYLSGAQVTRIGSFRFAEGAQNFIFKGLPAELQPESIQVSAGDGTVIRSVEHAVNYMQTADYTKEINSLKKKLDNLSHERQRENNQIELGLMEEKVFAENMKLAGSESGLKAEELKAAVLFYNERMAAIRETRMACRLHIEELDRQISALKAQLGRFSSSLQEPVSEITVSVSADASASADAERALTLSYFVYKAAWRPSYDIRAKDIDSEVALHYKANVSQSSGENWEEVKLTLSTGNPSVGGTCPELKPWYLDFYREPRHSQFQNFNAAPAAAKMTNDIAAEEECCEMAFESDKFETALRPATVMTESVTSAEYSITAPYTIASGDGSQDVEIMIHHLPSKYRYYSVRKLEREVFLLAAVSGWEHLNLIAGEASIFFESRYVGKTYIDPRRACEKIDLSLGVDKSVVVTRIRGKDFTAKTLTGGSVKQTRQWELTARNLKTVPVDIEMRDQVPVSTNKQIIVDVAEISGAEMDKDTGILTWKFTLKPAESKPMAVKYVVSSPKNTEVFLD